MLKTSTVDINNKVKTIEEKVNNVENVRFPYPAGIVGYALGLVTLLPEASLTVFVIIKLLLNFIVKALRNDDTMWDSISWIIFLVMVTLKWPSIIADVSRSEGISAGFETVNGCMKGLLLAIFMPITGDFWFIPNK